MASKDTLEMRFLDGSVRIRGSSIALRYKERLVLFAIALTPRPNASCDLESMIWPDFEPQRAHHALHETIRRIREQLADKSAITYCKDGYRLAEGSTVDLWEIDDLVSASRRGPLDRADVKHLRDLHVRLQAGRPAFLRTAEWFQRTERRLRDARRDVALILARIDLDRGDIVSALELGRELAYDDEYDEDARRTVILAHLARNDRVSAIREFREYEDVLTRDLQTTPSGSLKWLVV